MKLIGKTKRAQSGITLIEIMITAVIIGLVTSLAAPHFTTAWERQNFRSGGRALVSKLKVARSYAVSNKTQFGVWLGEEERTVTVFKDVQNLGGLTFDAGDSVISVDTLTEQFDVVASDCANNVIMFNPNGSADFNGGGFIYLVGSTESTVGIVTCDVLASTGRVQTESSFY